MRRIYRIELPLAEKLILHRYRKKARESGETRKVWDRFRKSKDSSPVAAALVKMSGLRGRCAYCSDSLASDIDHFRPLAVWPELAFVWKNLILVCTTCNRKKGKRFPVADDGDGLLIDPTIRDPWVHLTLDPQTGILAPRYLESGFDDRGETTLAILETINYEAVAEGRLRVVRRLIAAMKRVLDDENSAESVLQLHSEVAADDLGVSQWFAVWDGRFEEIPRELGKRYPKTWRRFVRKVLR